MPPMQQNSFDYNDLISCAKGKMFGPGNPQLPLPPMLMCDRITNISDSGGPHDKGIIRAELDINPDLWFFPCHFEGDPVMPGCLGMDALWQLVGFFLGWSGGEGRGRALSVGEVKFTGQILPTNKLVTFEIDMKRGHPAAPDHGHRRRTCDLRWRHCVRGQRHSRRPVQIRGGLIMRRVAITGIGIVSSIGNNVDEVTASLREGRSGIVHAPEYTELGFRSQVHGTVKMDVSEHIDRKQLRFMGEGAAYAVLSMEQAIADSGLSEELVSNPRTGLIAGSGGPSTANMLTAFDTTREKGPKRVGPYMVPRCMSSTVSACIATFFKIKGLNFSITSACSTSAHCISSAVDAIRNGSQDIVFAGGGEELHWTLSVLFDAMGAMSSKYNDTPERASRAYDSDRDGFVIAGGGGMVVVEDMEHALARGAKIYAEIVGYGANSDGHDMVAPSGEGAVRCMELALAGFDGNALTDKVDYINAHGTSTPVGDIKELEAVREVFGPRGYLPTVTSTKSLTGHSLGATGVQEAIYTMIMMREGFIAGSANIENPDPAIGDIPVPTSRVDDASITLALSNSFGFGGTNATLALRKV